MNSTHQYQINPDLQFFGKVNASISHELKNIFAIISETAGLMMDLMELEARGKSVDSQALINCGRDIIEEIERGFATIKQMNTFSHSVDNTLTDADIYELLNLVIAMAGFLSFTGKVNMIRPSSESCFVQTCPFRLQHLVYGLLTLIFQSVGAGGELDIDAVSRNDDVVEISFFNIHPEIKEVLPLQSLQTIAESIGAELTFRNSGQTIHLLLPRSFESAEFLPKLIK